MRICSPAVRAQFEQFDSLSIRNGMLCRTLLMLKRSHCFSRSWSDLIAALRMQFLDAIHSDLSARLKFAKSADQLQKSTYWHTWRRDPYCSLTCVTNVQLIYTVHFPSRPVCIPMLWVLLVRNGR